jgi:hypothetical protein
MSKLQGSFSERTLHHCVVALASNVRNGNANLSRLQTFGSSTGGGTNVGISIGTDRKGI